MAITPERSESPLETLERLVSITPGWARPGFLTFAEKHAKEKSDLEMLRVLRQYRNKSRELPRKT